MRRFERAVARYAGSPYAVAVNSCTNALFLCVRFIIQNSFQEAPLISVPCRTYLSVPMQIIHAGGRVAFRDEPWRGAYRLLPLPVWDCARRFTSGMYEKGQFQCISLHWSKILGLQQGGVILHDNDFFDEWARRARYDGRREGVRPMDDEPMLGWHMYISPEIAALGLVKMHFLPRVNEDLPNDDYPDLSTMEIFR